MSDTDSDSDPDREPASAFWRRLLEEQGVTPAELARAEETGTLQLLALERSILLDQPRFDVVEASVGASRLRRIPPGLAGPRSRP
ncbi:MAG: hypothetical protein U5R31_08335 [Acidimicrobiia bacterium]|nr:hypothetical protein [Acidimicrobiia bacterium]